MNANPETQHKVLILGNQEVGKTAIVNSVSPLSQMFSQVMVDRWPKST